MTMPGALRRVRAGVTRCTDQRLTPVLASYAVIWLSTLRTTTTSAPTTGEDNTSLEACAFHNAFPLPSNARIAPLTPPTTMTSPLLPTPAVRSEPALTRHCSLPVAASRRTRSPSASATKMLPAASTGENTAVPDLPSEYFHAVCTSMLDLNSTSGAGRFLASFDENNEQPANSAS